jgi:hypothetical protein
LTSEKLIEVMDLLNPEDEAFLTVAKGAASGNGRNLSTRRSVLGSVEQLKLTAETKHQRQVE